MWKFFRPTKIKDLNGVKFFEKFRKGERKGGKTVIINNLCVVVLSVTTMSSFILFLGVIEMFDNTTQLHKNSQPQIKTLRK